MDQIISLFRQFMDLFRFWVIVCPWEQAVRVRFGKRTKVLGSGAHFRIPLADKVFLQSTRHRICTTYRQTITTLDHKAVTVTAAVGYSISDVRLLYDTLHHAEDTIHNLVRHAMAAAVSSMDSHKLTLKVLTDEVEAKIDLSQYGISETKIYMNEFAFTRAYRFIGDSAQNYSNGSSLTTEKENTAP